MDCQKKKNTTRLQKMKKTQSKIKPIKTGKELGRAYCSGFKVYSHNSKPQEVKMTNKVLKENQTVLFVNLAN